MRRALRLAALGRHASPNPMVGCVLVKDGMKVGEGYHPGPGLPHAEVWALRQAQNEARGATAYVTLEPCAHFGRTPPCASALAEAGVVRVVAAATDPDARVSGAGFKLLANGGIEPAVGVLEDEATRLNAAFFKHRLTGLPYVVIKVAVTLDGRIAAESGDSRWITSPVTRRWVHRGLRDRVDAVMVGVGSAIADDPRLTTRLRNSAPRNPLRVVVDSRLRLGLGSKLVQSASDGLTLVAHTSQAPAANRIPLQERGVILLECLSDDRGRVSLRDLLIRLGTRGDLISVLVEGGGEIIASLLEDRLVDRYICAVAPKIIGGRSSLGPVGGAGIGTRMADAMPVCWSVVRRSGPDIVLDARTIRHLADGRDGEKGIITTCSPA